MTKVLLIGQTPDTVDYSDPALPPGLTAGKIQAGLDLARQSFVDRGWQGDLCIIDPDDAGIAQLTAQLAAVAYDVIIIGGGIRVPAKGLHLFETIVNIVHKTAPGAAIAFNTRPDDSADAAARWI